MGYHPLLVRQLRGLTVPGEDAFPGWSKFLERVNEAYAQADGDQKLLQRSLDLSSRELLHSNAELRIVIQSFPDIYFRVGPDGTILSCRAGHPDDLLFSAAQLIGRRIQTLPGQAARQRFRDALGVVVAGGPAQLVEYVLTVGATERMYEARLLPVHEDQVLAIVRNITERKQAEAGLIRAREAAVEVAQIKSEFLANMSHEIRTPLTCVIGMTELVLEMDLAAEARQFMTSIKSSADALHGIVNDLLDFSRMESGRIQLEQIPFSLRDCVGMAISSLAFRAQQKGLELLCHIAPEAADRLVGDPGRLRQLLLHLVGNAIKFTEHGEVVLQLDVVSETPEDATLRFSVRDTGIGIALDRQAAIFEAFAQADGSMTRRYGGTGLGLAIATQLIDLMRGSLRLESKLGVGSTFTFEVPIARESAAAGPAPRTSPDVIEGVRVLVVDDNATNRSLFASALEQWRAHPTTVANGEEALAELDRGTQAGAPYGLVLLDMHMPGRDGFEVAAEIAGHLVAGAPIVVLTSTGQPGDAARCRELGLAAYLTKPVLGTELLEAIRAVFRAPGAGRERTLVTRHSLRENGRRFRILLAEDNHLNRTIVTRILEKRGYGVVAVEDGRRALQMLDREAFDLVLMDIQMPVLDGLETMTIIRTRERDTGAHLPIVALTAHAMSGDEERCRAAGADAYLIKPIDSQQLLATIETLGTVRADRADAPENGAGPDPFDEVGALRRLNGDRALLEEVITVHLENRAAFLHTLDQALETADGARLRGLAHEMKGELATLGAASAAAAAAQLEIAATGTDRDAPGDAAQVLRDELRRLQGALERPRHAA